MKKSERIAELVQGLGVRDSDEIDSRIVGYFECFNTGRYYEAHDVLEDLWLRQGKNHPDYAFHKGLIQLAGGFVHLRLQYLYPDHPKHGRRLAPACRLLLLAVENLHPYPPRHLGVDVAAAIHLAEKTTEGSGEVGAWTNPWSPSMLPSLKLTFPPDQERR
jgi:hypothetical protein